VPYPFSTRAALAAGPDFVVECLPNGTLFLPSINVIVTGFGQGFITVDNVMRSRVREQS
jgi:hypothetical protein